ncbi:MAG: hypothetical protein WBQ10_11315 [Terriglobales bacterium]
MPLHPNVRRCTHIQITGHRCGSPALKQEYFCYFHTRMIKGVQTRVDSQIHPVALIENAEAIQAAIMHMIDAVLKGTIDNKRANIVLKALHIAVRNSRNVYFHIRQDDMVREVPNFAEQYLTEHPELGPPITHVAPDAPVREAGQCSAEDRHPEKAQASAKRSPDNEEPAPSVSRGSLHSPADPAAPPNASLEKATAERGTESTAERGTESAAERRQRAAHGASRGNQAENRPAPEGRKSSCDSRVPPERGSAAEKNSLPTPKEKAHTDTAPPLTNRQSELNQELKKLEACIEGAMRGNWRDLRTVFNAIGLTPRKPPSRQRIAPGKKIV